MADNSAFDFDVNLSVATATAMAALKEKKKAQQQQQTKPPSSSSKRKSAKAADEETTPTTKKRKQGVASEKTSHKSDAIAILRSQWPDAFWPSASNPKPLNYYEDRGSVLVFIDILQVLKTYGTTETTNPLKPDSYIKKQFEDLLEGMCKDANNMFKQSSKVKVIFLCCDKYPFVQTSKAVEQLKRTLRQTVLAQEAALGMSVELDEDKLAEEEAADEDDRRGSLLPEDGIRHRDRRPYLKLGRDVPSDFKVAVHDRKGTLPVIIEEVFRELVNPLTNRRPGARNNGYTSFDVPLGRRVVCDGHYLTLEDLRTMQCVFPSRDMAIEAWLSDTRGKKLYEPLNDPQLWAAHHFVDDIDIFCTPICVERMVGPNYEDMRIAYMVPELANAHGEADFGIFALHALACTWLAKFGDITKEPGPGAPPNQRQEPVEPRMLSMSILSVDTDLVEMSGIYLENARMIADWYCADEKDFSLWVRFKPSMGWVFGTFSSPYSEYCEWVNITLLYKLIQVSGVFTPSPPALVTSKGSRKKQRAMWQQVWRGRMLDSLNSLSELVKRTGGNVIDVPAADQNTETTSSTVRKRKPPKQLATAEPALLTECSKKFKEQIEFRWWNVICTLLMCGGDFTTGFYGFNYEGAFNAHRQFCDYVGDLVQPRTLDTIESRRECLKMCDSFAVRTYRTAAIFKANAPQGISEEEMESLFLPPSQYMIVDGEAHIKMVCAAVNFKRKTTFPRDPQHYTFAQMINGTARLADINKMPVWNEIWTRRGHLSGYVYQLSQVGLYRVIFERQNFDDYGYRRLDPSKPYSTTNILRSIN